MTPAQWTEEARKLLKGRTIEDVQYYEDMDWGHNLCLELDDGTKAFVASDDEGNQAGALHLEIKDECKVLPRLL